MLTINVTVDQDDTTIAVAISDAIAIADKLGVIVEFEYNGVEIAVDCFSSVFDVLSNYERILTYTCVKSNTLARFAAEHNIPVIDVRLSSVEPDDIKGIPDTE